MKTWTKATCLTLCAGLMVAGVAAGWGKADPQDEMKKKLQEAQKHAEELKKGHQPGDQAPPGLKGDDKALWDQMMQYAKPAAEHDIIKNFAGTWDVEVKAWMDPSVKEPNVSKGTMKGTLVNGGNFLLGQFNSTFMQIPFTGTLLWGYNRIDKHYQAVWCDSMGTNMMMSTGQPSEGGKVIESTCTFNMPRPDGKMMEIGQREKMTMVSKDKYFQEMWHTAKGQGETKVMELTYTRAAGDAKAPPAPAPAAAVPGTGTPSK